MSDKIPESTEEIRKSAQGDISLWINLDDIPPDETPDGNRDIDRYDLNKQKVARYSQNTKERRGLSKWVKWAVSSWLFCVMVIIFLKGSCVLNISDVVICTLLGTTTINILGLAHILLNGLFPESRYGRKNRKR
jgi:hypothetical protein